MLKKISLFFMLLLTFFALSFYGINKPVNAEELDQTVLNQELAAVKRSVPEKAIISFPVTHVSIYGNYISWNVEPEQDVITFDSEANWMVVDRSKVTEVEASVDLTVTITDKNNAQNFVTDTFTVKVPKGTTYTKQFTISYELDKDVSNNENNPTSYSLGDPTITLLAPNHNDPTKVFVGWYEGDTKVDKILVGSMKDYNLKAHWDDRAITGISVVSSKNEYTADDAIDLNALTVTATYNYGEPEIIASSWVEVVGNPTQVVGENVQVTVALKDNPAITATFTIKVNKIKFDTSKLTVLDYSDVYDGESHTVTVNGLPEWLEVASSTSATNVSTVEATTSFKLAKGYSEDKYEVPAPLTKGTITITKASVALTATAKEAALNASISWAKTDFSGTFINNDTVDVLDLSSMNVEYYDDETETKVLPENFVCNKTYTAIITGITANNYDVTVSNTTVTILQIDVEIELEQNSFEYNGEAQEVEAIAKINGEVVNDASFSYEYVNGQGTKAGSYAVKVTFTHTKYGAATTELNYSITAKAVTVTLDPATLTSVYGDAIKEIGIIVNGAYKDDAAESIGITATTSATSTSDAGEYEVIVNIANNDSNYDASYSGTDKYTITRKALTENDVQITLLGGDYNANYSNYTPGVTVMYGDVEITGSTLSYAYENESTKLGVATLTVTLNGNYTGSFTRNFTVTEYGQAGVDAAFLPEEITEYTYELPVELGLSKVNWVSNNTGYSVDSDGKVIITFLADSYTVKLTATVTYNDTSAVTKEYTFDVNPLVNAKDENSGVIVGGLQKSITVSATEAEGNFTIDADLEKVAAYDIKLLKGEDTVQPYGTVTVLIPIANYQDGKEYKVYYINGTTAELIDGSEIVSSVSAGKTQYYISFETDHFSVYAVYLKVEKYTVTFNGAEEIADAIVKEGEKVAKPADPVEKGYSFAGWYTDEECNNEYNFDSIVTESFDLYAKWEDLNTIKLVTDVAELAAGDEIIIVAAGYEVALSTEQKSNNRGQTAITKASDLNTLTLSKDVQIIKLEEGNVEGTYAFNVDGKYLYAASSSGNYLKSNDVLDENGSWRISITDSVASIVAQGENERNILQYNQSSSLFACYDSVSQKAISIYIVYKSDENRLVDAKMI